MATVRTSVAALSSVRKSKGKERAETTANGPRYLTLPEMNLLSGEDLVSNVAGRDR